MNQMVRLNHVHEYEGEELATKTKPVEQPKISNIYGLLVSSSIRSGSSASPNRLQKSSVQSLPASSTPGRNLRKTSMALLRSTLSPSTTPRLSANDAPSQPVAAPLAHRNTHESSTADTLGRNEDTLHEIELQLASEARVVPGKWAQDSAGLSSSNDNSTTDIEVTNVDGENDTGKEEESGDRNKDGEVERFNVEAIMGCKLNPRGVVLLQVKWEGYEEIADITWEPERTLRKDVPDITNAYFEELGGRNKILKELRRKLTEGKANGRGKRTARARGRAYDAEPNRRRRRVD